MASGGHNPSQKETILKLEQEKEILPKKLNDGNFDECQTCMLRSMLEDKEKRIRQLEEQNHSTNQKVIELEAMLAEKEQELSESESRYKRYVNRAKQAFKNLEPLAIVSPCSSALSSSVSADEVSYLRAELQAKERHAAELELELEKVKVVKEMEEKLMTVAVHNLVSSNQKCFMMT